VARAEKLDVSFSAMRGLRVFQPTGFKLPKQIDEELPIGEDGHTRAPDHTRDRMGEFPSVAFWNWSQPSTDWFNLATGEALADYNPSPVMRELVLGIESQSADPQYLAQHALNAEKHATQRGETRTSTRVWIRSTRSDARNTHVNASRHALQREKHARQRASTRVDGLRRAPARGCTIVNSTKTLRSSRRKSGA